MPGRHEAADDGQSPAPDGRHRRSGQPHHLRHPHLLDADDDRWLWRAKIRRDPRKLFFYRIGVLVAGLVLMIGAILTGPIPGPGGIPLFLLGLAVWASEFEWAQSVMVWFKKMFRRYLRLPRSKRILFWVVVIVGAWIAGYVGMLLFGIPPWAPGWARRWLVMLPGL